MIGSDFDRVLVVDDEPAIVDLMELYLKSDYEIIRAYNGKEALEKARSEKPAVVILDVMMPDMNGYEVCKVLKTSVETQFIPIVMVTALSGKDEKIKGLESGADEFLSKPVNRLELVTRVKSLTRIKHLQERILAERNDAYQCIDVAGIIMLVVDSEQKINLVNCMGNEILGYDEFELIGQDMFDVLIPIEDREKEKQIFSDMIRGKVEFPSTIERKVIKKNGENIIVKCNHSLMYDGEGNIEALIVSGQDITELRRKEDLLLNSKKMGELFSDMLHHDLLDPAVIVKEYAQVLLEQETNPQNMVHIREIVQNITSMVETMKSASAYLHLQSDGQLETEVMDITEIIRKVVTKLSIQLKGKGLSLIINIDGKHLSIANSMVETVFSNLINNAIIRSPVGDSIKILIEDDSKMWKVSVADSGERIPDRDIKYLLSGHGNPSEHIIPGSRLSFFTINKIMALLGGDIGLDNTLQDKGALFWVKLKKGA